MPQKVFLKADFLLPNHFPTVKSSTGIKHYAIQRQTRWAVDNNTNPRQRLLIMALANRLVRFLSRRTYHKTTSCHKLGDSTPRITQKSKNKQNGKIPKSHIAIHHTTIRTKSCNEKSTENKYTPRSARSLVLDNVDFVHQGELLEHCEQLRFRHVLRHLTYEQLHALLLRHYYTAPGRLSLSLSIDSLSLLNSTKNFSSTKLLNDDPSAYFFFFFFFSCCSAPSLRS